MDKTKQRVLMLAMGFIFGILIKEFVNYLGNPTVTFWYHVSIGVGCPLILLILWISIKRDEIRKEQEGK